jgi:hypothetical protein
MLPPGGARKLLAAIRIMNGAAGLLVPDKLLGRLGVDITKDRSGTYPFRMFGIRTILIGLDLVVLIHATDTVSAAVTTARGDLPPKQGLVAIGISAVNTGLAVVAWKGGRRALVGPKIAH